MIRLLLTLMAFALCSGSAIAKKPNIVLIFMDDLGYGELGCQGNPEIPTPHIDSIAKNGIRFTDGYVTSPYCSPSRAGLMTGRYQTRFGHELNVVGERNLDPHIGLPTSEITLATALKKAGYSTGLIGKWHLGATEKYHPHNHGFDEFFGFLHEGRFYAPPPFEGIVSHLRENEPPYNRDNPLLRGTKEVSEPEYLTDAFSREAVAFIDRHQEKPFFLYLSYNAIHSPMQAPKEYVDRFKDIEDEQRRVFAGMLSPMDDGIGRVLTKLREAGLEENTLIFCLSDNGGPTKELTSSNKPLSGGKGQLWEGGIRIPFLMQWKGELPAGEVYDKPVISLDIFPTSLAAAGAKVPSDRPIDGVNLLPYLKNEKKGRPHQTLYWRYGENFALRDGDWKIVRQSRTYMGPAKVHLVDLSKDFAETTDVAKKYPVRLGRMMAEYKKLDAQMMGPRWER